MRNLPEFVIGFWGAALLGAIVVPLNSWWTGAELTYALENAGATVAFVDDERLERVVDHGGAGGTRLVGVRTDRAADAAVRRPGARRAAPRRRRRTPRTRRPGHHPLHVGHDGPAEGRARHQPRSPAQPLEHGVRRRARGDHHRPRPAPDRQPATLAAQPMFHIGGIAAIIGSPMGGSKILIMRKWDLERALQLAVDEGLTAFGGVPAIARQIIEYPGLEELDLDVRGFPMGGAAVPPDLPVKARKRFGESIQLLNGYGLTETTSAVVTNVGVEFVEHPDSVGRPNLTADLKVVDPDGNALGVGEVGELAFRSPQVVKGYWGDEAATKAVFVDGWFHSGDVGFVDADGYVYVVDRIKDVVIRGGENVYCAEVEAVLFEHPDIAEVAVVGIVEPTLGERVCAVVVARPDRTPDLNDVRSFAAQQLAAFKCPEALLLVDVLPKTATEKVAKNVLRDRLADPGEPVERMW